MLKLFCNDSLEKPEKIARLFRSLENLEVSDGSGGTLTLQKTGNESRNRVHHRVLYTPMMGDAGLFADNAPCADDAARLNAPDIAVRAREPRINTKDWDFDLTP